jgi:hypothetical protein
LHRRLLLPTTRQPQQQPSLRLRSGRTCGPGRALLRPKRRICGAGPAGGLGSGSTLCAGRRRLRGRFTVPERHLHVPRWSLPLIFNFFLLSGSPSIPKGTLCSEANASPRMGATSTNSVPSRGSSRPTSPAWTAQQPPTASMVQRRWNRLCWAARMSVIQCPVGRWRPGQCAVSHWNVPTGRSACVGFAGAKKAKQLSTEFAAKPSTKWAIH